MLATGQNGGDDLICGVKHTVSTSLWHFPASIRQHENGEFRPISAGVAETAAILLLFDIHATSRRRLKQCIPLCSRASSGLMEDSRLSGNARAICGDLSCYPVRLVLLMRLLPPIRHVTAAVKKKIAAAQKARWENLRRAKSLKNSAIPTAKGK